MSIADSAALQFRSIKTLMLKRFRTRYAGSRAGYAWAIIEPLAWVFVLKFAFAGHSNLPPIGTSYEVFFATGVTLARMWRSASATVMGPLMKPPRKTFPVFSRLDQTYAIWAMESITGGVVLIVILTLLGIFGMDSMPADLLSCIITYFALTVFTLSFAAFFAVIIFVAPFMSHFRSIVFMIMFFTSGFATVLDRIPPAWRDVISWNPLVHFIEWFREGFYPGYDCANLDLEYVFTFTVICLLIGLVGERAFRRRALAPAA
ncbi:ABC transporter permease [Methylopila henanensis]|uniref:ABC transporter permease n=1 Tax=Methylopila henanensis TaxID=873516 RepID=A0ABW4K5M8_9HYPH